jgi:Sec-independent protein secretion pathway component TatC
MAIPFLGFTAAMVALAFLLPWPLWLRVVVAIPFLVLFSVGVLMLVMAVRERSKSGEESNAEPGSGGNR